MKRTFLISLLTLAFFITGVSNSQAQNFNPEFKGIFTGTVTKNDGSDDPDETIMQFNFRVSEYDGKLICNRQFSKDGEIYNDLKENFSFTYQENSAVYTWINSGGVWTEIQTFLFTLNDGDLQIIHMRWVNNKSEEGNEIWGYYQSGILERQY
jgi:hypothetical protein